MTTVYLAFLTRGDKWTPEKTPQTEAIQRAHMDNINRLAETRSWWSPDRLVTMALCAASLFLKSVPRGGQGTCGDRSGSAGGTPRFRHSSLASAGRDPP